MSHDSGKPHRPKMVYVKAHYRSKPEKTDGPNPTVFKILVEHYIKRMHSELCRRY